MNAYSPPLPRHPASALARWLRLPAWRRRAIASAVAQGEMTTREIAREFQCSRTLVAMARAVGA